MALRLFFVASLTWTDCHIPPGAACLPYLMSLLSISAVVSVLWCLRVAWPWFRHWKRARQLNLPIVLSPTSNGSFGWLCLQYAWRYGLIPNLLANLAVVRLSRPNWQFREKFSVYRDYGKLFILVTPSGYELFVADKELTRQILYRRSDFPKPIHMLSMSFSPCPRTP